MQAHLQVFATWPPLGTEIYPPKRRSVCWCCRSSVAEINRRVSLCLQLRVPVCVPDSPLLAWTAAFTGLNLCALQCRRNCGVVQHFREEKEVQYDSDEWSGLVLESVVRPKQWSAFVASLGLSSRSLHGSG
jgi:hypothetical protein